MLALIKLWIATAWRNPIHMWSLAFLETGNSSSESIVKYRRFHFGLKKVRTGTTFASELTIAIAYNSLGS
jgi:hypothetical protein